jgi:hypothetical protein
MSRGARQRKLNYIDFSDVYLMVNEIVSLVSINGCSDHGIGKARERQRYSLWEGRRAVEDEEAEEIHIPDKVSTCQCLWIVG